MKHIFYFVCLVLIIGMSLNHISAQSTDLQIAVDEQVRSTYLFVPQDSTVSLLDVNLVNIWAFGSFFVPAQNEGAPISGYFLAKTSPDGWVVALESTSSFMSWLTDISTELIPSNLYDLFAVSSAQGNGASQLSLPFPTGETWTFTGGPHHSSDGYSQPWNSIDFAGGTGSVRAAADGVAAIICPNYIQITHYNGYKTIYYHVANIAIAHGQTVLRGQHLGQISAQVGCGGSASGAHVHFALYQGSTMIALNGIDIGGWTIEQGSSAYSGSMRRMRDGHRVNVGGQITNEGSIGSGALPVAPAHTQLIQNGTFDNDNDVSNWFFWGDIDYIVDAGRLVFKGRAGGSMATVEQSVPYSIPANSTLELRLRLANPGAITKQVNIRMVRVNGDIVWGNIVACSFIISPNTPFQLYTIREKVDVPWESILFWVEAPVDGIPDLNLDDVEMYHYPSLTLAQDNCEGPTNTTDWNFNAGLHGWTIANHLDTPRQLSTSVSMRITGRDTHIHGPTVNINASSFRYIAITMDVQTYRQQDCGQIFFEKQGQYGFQEPQSVLFNLNPNGQVFTYYIDMKSNQNWSGTITRLRLDPSCNEVDMSKSNTFGIHRILLTNTNPNITPTPTHTPTPTRTPTPTPTHTSTPVPSNTSLPTNTDVPTNTPVFTNTPAPTSPACRVDMVVTDGVVNILDIQALANSFNASLGDALYNATHDLDNNGTINVLDIQYAAGVFGQSCS